MLESSPVETRSAAKQRIVGLEEATESVTAVEYDIAGDIDERNGWTDEYDDGEYLRNDRSREVAVSLTDIADWLTKNIKFDTRVGMFRFAVRCLAMLWVIYPDMLRGKNGKIASLEKMAGTMDLTKCWLSMVAEDFSRKFKFFSRNQKSMKSRANYADGAKAGWDKRRAKAAVEDATKVSGGTKKRST